MGVASAKKLRLKSRDIAVPSEPYEMPSTMSVNLKKFPILNEGQPEDKVTYYFSGVITAVRKDKYAENMDIEIKSITKDKK